MSFKVLEDTLEVEKRKGPKGSYNTNFAHIKVIDDGVRKSLDLYYNPHNGEYGLEVYQGYNYDPKASIKDRSYSRQYKQFKGMPEKYAKVAQMLYNKVAKKD